MRRSSWTVAAAVVMATGAAAAEEIGSVYQKDYSGALGLRTDGVTDPLHYGTKVFTFETVTTGPASTTNLLFRDTTSLQVGNSSRVVLDNFIFDPAPGQGEAVLKLGRGAFRVITGYTKPEDNFTIRTPTVGMTIRGTELMIFVLSDGTTEMSVVHGKVETQPCGSNPVMMVETNQAILVDRECAVTQVEARQPPPRLTPPTMPAELAALDIEPAAGPVDADPPAGAPASPPDRDTRAGAGKSSSQASAGPSGPSGPSGPGGDPGGGGGTPGAGGGGTTSSGGGGESGGGPRGGEGGGRGNP
jgi:uncharacterized membrane protein YgcG